MYHVHTSTLSSSTTTTEPVSSLSPSVLFPFFQPYSAPHSSAATAATAAPASSCPDPSQPASAFRSPYTTTTSSTSSCPCHAPHSLPPAATAPPTFITLPSANPHQSVILPLPQPSPPPASASASPSCPASSAASSAADGSLPASKSPLLVFSHGSTQVDTFVPSSQCLQRTLYSWSQLSDYSTKYCWHLPTTSSSSTQSSQAAGQPVGHNVSINNSNGRICQGDDVLRCPGHPWVNFSYHMQVKQWQERKEDAVAAAAAAAASAGHQSVTTHPTTVSHQLGSDMSVKGIDVQVAAPGDIFVAGVRRRRFPAQAHSDADSDVGSMFDDADGEDADDEDASWNELCSSTEDDDDSDDFDYELTDVDM